MTDYFGKAPKPGQQLCHLLAESTGCLDPSAIELKKLEVAFAYPFGEPVTAFLTRAQIISASCLGVTHRHVRADSRGLFQDGHRIVTSDIRSAYQVGAYWCLRTVTGSLYVVVAFSDGVGKASLDEFLLLSGAGIHPAPHRCH